jgi:hypothetical protein
MDHQSINNILNQLNNLAMRVNVLEEKLAVSNQPIQLRYFYYNNLPNFNKYIYNESKLFVNRNNIGQNMFNALLNNGNNNINSKIDDNNIAMNENHSSNNINASFSSSKSSIGSNKKRNKSKKYSKL